MAAGGGSGEISAAWPQLALKWHQRRKRMAALAQLCNVMVVMSNIIPSAMMAIK
jgi:hypothetical protein